MLATMKELLEVVFSMQSVPRLYRKEPSQKREYVVGARWSPACKDMSPEAEGRLPLEAVTEQRD
jgi:hypothetical protein